MNETTETPISEQEPIDAPNVPETSQDAEDNEKKDPVEQLAAELNEANDKYLRLYSDFDNFRKRNLKERLDLIKTASEHVILSLLPVLDDFERALSSVLDEATKSGFELIYNKLKTALEAQGLKAMETKGVAFDADLHEAVAQTPADKKQKGLVIDQAQRGYYLNDKVIRHAMVIVGA